MGEPKLLICDEPTSALDPLGRKELLDILRTISARTTVLFSTHILSDVERICDRVALLNEGKIAVSGDLAALKARHGKNALRVEFADAEDLARLTVQSAVMPFLTNSRQEGTAMIIESRDHRRSAANAFRRARRNAALAGEGGNFGTDAGKSLPGGDRMKGFAAFFKKEWLENLHNHRLLILAALFLIFGITNAPLAKYTPELLASLANGFTLDAAPVALDAWTQFFKNASSLGMSIAIILFGSTLANEYSRGTLVLLVTKGLSRRVVILAKYAVSALIMSGCYWLCYTLTYGYTAYYWPENQLSHTALISGEIAPGELVTPLVVSIALTLLALVVAVKRFARKGL